MPTMLDLFSGLGGASQAMLDRGWQVIRVDIAPEFHPDICADVRFLDAGQFRAIDLLWASPPCEDFSREWMPWSRTGKTPDLTLVEATRRLIAEVKPRWWIVENVRGAEPWLGRSRMRYGAFHLWGNFPLFLARPHSRKERMSSTWAAERAKIPYELSLAVALAVERADEKATSPTPQVVNR